MPLRTNKTLNKLDFGFAQDSKSQIGNDASSRLFAARHASGKENFSRQSSSGLGSG